MNKNYWHVQSIFVDFSISIWRRNKIISWQFQFSQKEMQLSAVVLNHQSEVFFLVETQRFSYIILVFSKTAKCFSIRSSRVWLIQLLCSMNKTLSSQFAAKVYSQSVKANQLHSFKPIKMFVEMWKWLIFKHKYPINKTSCKGFMIRAVILLFPTIHNYFCHQS